MFREERGKKTHDVVILRGSCKIALMIDSLLVTRPGLIQVATIAPVVQAKAIVAGCME